MECFELTEQLQPFIKAGDTEFCLRRVSETLAAVPVGPFHRILEMDFTNRPQDVAAYLDGFIRGQKAQFKIAAIYTEMNGFEINPERWFFDIFAYEDYGGSEDYDWLAKWDSGRHDDLTLRGLETLQEVYAACEDRDDKLLEAYDYCSLLIVI